MGDLGAAQAVPQAQEVAFAVNGEEDEVRVLLSGMEEVAGRFDGGVASLDGLLRGREVAPHDDIEMLGSDLREAHASLLLARDRTRAAATAGGPVLPAGIEPALTAF